MKGGRRNSPSYIPMQVIPAAPGYFVISPVYDSDKTQVFIDHMADPVIGWAIDRDSLQPYPITLNGVEENTPSILKPDGSIDRLGMESYASLANWIADLKNCTGRNY
jgi:hypothetical protein